MVVPEGFKQMAGRVTPCNVLEETGAQNAEPRLARSAKGSLDLVGPPRDWGAAGVQGTVGEAVALCMHTMLRERADHGPSYSAVGLLG